MVIFSSRRRSFVFNCSSYLPWGEKLLFCCDYVVTRHPDRFRIRLYIATEGVNYVGIRLTPSLSCLCFKHGKLFSRVGLANKGPRDVGMKFSLWQQHIVLDVPGLLDDHKPAPVPHAHVLPEVSLADLDQLTLVSFLAKDVAADSFQNLALYLSDKFYHQLVPFFLKSSQCAGPEEDNGVSLNCNM